MGRGLERNPHPLHTLGGEKPPLYWAGVEPKCDTSLPVFLSVSRSSSGAIALLTFTVFEPRSTSTSVTASVNHDWGHVTTLSPREGEGVVRRTEGREGGRERGERKEKGEKKRRKREKKQKGKRERERERERERGLATMV